MEINWISILVAGVAAWALGALWYSPLLFGKTWQKELGFTDDDMKGSNMAMIFGGSLILMMIMMIPLTFVVGAHDAAEITWSHGFFHGAMIGVMVAAASMGITYLYQRRTLKLYFIDALYQVLFMGLGGAVIALFAK